MPRLTRWSQLTIGIVTLLAVIGIAAAVLVFARVGALHGAATRIYMATDRANRVITGTDVWLAGQKVGVVDAVEFRPVGVDTTQRLLVSMRVLDPYMKYIRRNSTAQIRSGTTLIGAPVVFITIGRPPAPMLHAGDTLYAISQYESQPASAGLGSITDSVAAIIAGAQAISGQLDTTFRVIQGVKVHTVTDVHAVSAALDNFERRAFRSHGTVALAVGDTSRLRTEVEHLRALTDSLRAAATGPHGVGRFAHDTTLAGHARHALATADSLHVRLLSYAGGTPTPAGDSTLVLEVARTHAELDSLIADVKHHPLRYLPF